MALRVVVRIIKDKTFFYASWEQFRLRQGGSTSTTTVPLPQMFGIGTPGGVGDFSSLCPGISPTGVCPAAEVLAGTGIQIYDPYTTGPAGTGARQPYLGNIIPANEISPAAIALYQKLYPLPNAAGTVNGTQDNYVTSPSTGGNTNQIVVRGDQNINSTTRLFGRFSYFGLTDLPNNPYNTGLCADRCTETLPYQGSGNRPEPPVLVHHDF